MYDVPSNDTDPAFFYISSRGGSATTWLGRALSMHPSVVAFHGSEAVPAFNECGGYHDVKPADFFRYLKTMGTITSGEKYFGAIHLYYGDKAYDATIAENGLFSAVIRDPIRRINSLYWDYAQRHLGGNITDRKINIFNALEGLPADDLACPPISEVHCIQYAYERTNDSAVGVKSAVDPLRQFLYRSKQNIKGMLTPTPPPNDQSPRAIARLLAQEFSHLAGEIVAYDLDCWRVCKKTRSMIQMEEMVASREYFQQTVWPNVAPHLECNDTYLDRVMASGKTNVHALEERASIDIYNKWSPGFQKAFQEIIDVLGRNEVSEMYQNFGYKLPH